MPEFYSLNVKKVVDETSQARSFVLAPVRSDMNLFRYQPGQFLSFQIAHESGTIDRSYSISSAPCYDPDITVCVKRVFDGRGSNWFNDNLRVGSRIPARIPAGRFTLDKRESDLLIIAGGSGITPCISIIKQALHETGRKVKLIYANRNIESIIYANVLCELQKRFAEQFECRHWLDIDNGYISDDDIVSFAKGFENASCYICGPAALMDNAEDVLCKHYGQTLSIKTERFISPDDPSASAQSVPAQSLGIDTVSGFQLKYDGRSHALQLAPGQTLLAAALAANLDIPSSCTEGHCGTCIARLLDGEVSMVSTRALSKRSLQRGHILLCQARRNSDKPLVVDLDF